MGNDKKLTFIETTTDPATRAREWEQMQNEALVRTVIHAVSENEELRSELVAALTQEIMQEMFSRIENNPNVRATWRYALRLDGNE